MTIVEELQNEMPKETRSDLRTARKILSGNGKFSALTDMLLQSRMYRDGEEMNENDQKAREIAAKYVESVYKDALDVMGKAHSALESDDNPDSTEIRKLEIMARDLAGEIQDNFPETVYEEGEVPVLTYAED